MISSFKYESFFAYEILFFAYESLFLIHHLNFSFLFFIAQPQAPLSF